MVQKKKTNRVKRDSFLYIGINLVLGFIFSSWIFFPVSAYIKLYIKLYITYIKLYIKVSHLNF